MAAVHLAERLDVPRAIELDGDVVAYTRASFEDVEGGLRDLVVFTPTSPEHLAEPLVGALIDGNEAHMCEWANGPSRYRAYAAREAPDRPATAVAAWAGDTVVGQVKSYVNADENRQRGYLRGYTEDISTHADWRNRGIAGALLAMSLEELRSRGLTEAALGVDTNNPGGAFHLYTSLGFELRSYEAVYTKPV